MNTAKELTDWVDQNNVYLLVMKLAKSPKKLRKALALLEPIDLMLLTASLRGIEDSY